jgi:hypothetical protein
MRVGGSTTQATSVLTAQHATPNDCILLNRGDYNACNFGNTAAATRLQANEVRPQFSQEASLPRGQ